MAGIEKLEIHSKSYIIRWVQVDDGHTISWNVQPHKKSINFGIVKHPGNGGTTLASIQAEFAGSDLPSAPAPSQTETSKNGVGSGGGTRPSKKQPPTAQEQLARKGFIPIIWLGRCEAGKVSRGTHVVQSAQGGMFGLVFDNTFSKQTAKTASLALLTYPTDAPPPATAHLPNLAAPSNATAKRKSFLPSAARNQSTIFMSVSTPASQSMDSLTLPNRHPQANGQLQMTTRQQQNARRASMATINHPHNPDSNNHNNDHNTSSGSNGNCYVGSLLKRRRRKGQGYARRYFSLDFTTCTLSYYYNRQSSALRGAIPLSLAAIAADERRREINVDSGAEIWHIRASNTQDFEGWARALARATRLARDRETTVLPPPSYCGDSTTDAQSVTQSMSMMTIRQPPPASATPQEQTQLDEAENREWQQAEALVSRIAGTRDALRRLVQDMGAAEPSPTPQTSSQRPLSSLSSYTSGTHAQWDDLDGYFPPPTVPPPLPPTEKRPFWKRKGSGRPHTSRTPATTSQSSFASEAAKPEAFKSKMAPSITGGGGGGEEPAINAYEHCSALLSDLDSVVSEFSSLIAASKQRRMSSATSAAAAAAAAAAAEAARRRSYESSGSMDEFFDAEAGDGDVVSPMLRIDPSGADDGRSDIDAADDVINDSSSVDSSRDDADDFEPDHDSAVGLYPARPKSFAPLPLQMSITRRNKIPPAIVAPPSLIAFVRKNVGKDLSTISMPVSANEPLSMLQRVAEQLEYAQLLDTAATLSEPTDRVLYVAAFAVSQFSNGRVRSRAARKPFNPLLGETFELVRTAGEVPGNFRLLLEKVCHRPVRLAMQADAPAWSVSQTAAPTQRFWGKSAEITTEGRQRVTLRLRPSDNWTLQSENNGSIPSSAEEEHYSWSVATVFLRNVVMGEKYVEPVGTMHVTNDGTGARATIEFRSRGMFGGRCEEVHIQAFDSSGRLASALTGTWTESLRFVASGREIWRTGPLVPHADKAYGLTTFAAGLNEVTPLEEGLLPPTDSRLRPDQRLVEAGRLDEAEGWKGRLEEAQRKRRREMEERGEEWRPRWFVRAAGSSETGEEVWRLKVGKDGYWEERERVRAAAGGKLAVAGWTSVEEIFKG